MSAVLKAVPDPLTLLVVEDTDLDFERLKRGLAGWHRPHRIVRARDGLDALNHIHGAGGHAAIDGPFVTIVDINMPRMNGFEFIEQMFPEPEFAPERTIIMSTSDCALDIERAEIIGIANYLLKPVNATRLHDMLDAACADILPDGLHFDRQRMLGADYATGLGKHGADLVVVDDDLMTLDYIDYRLSKSSLNVRCFDDAEVALQFLRTETPRTLIVDQRMPRMTGLELLTELTERRIDMPTGRTFLTSAIEISASTDAAVRAMGARFLLKSTYMNGEGLNALVESGQGL